jgi:Uncharacterised nucleotidyltransferase
MFINPLVKYSHQMSELKLPEFPAELTLAIACSRWPFSKSVDRDIQTIARSPIDWNGFLAWVRRNGVTPLVYHNFRRTRCSLVPEAVLAQLQGEAARNTRRVLVQIAEAARITRLLADAGIGSLIIKGPVLSLLAFGDLSLRQSRDIDLMLDPARVVEADRLITQAGYRRVRPEVELTQPLFEVYQRWRGQSAYYLDSSDVILEIHWRLTSNSLLFPFDAATLRSSAQQVQVAGTTFATFSDEALFLYLCVHGSVHFWFRLKWVTDIAALLYRLRPEVIDGVASSAQMLGLHRPFHAALILAHKLMAAPVPIDILTKAQQDPSATKLAIAGHRALNWNRSPGEPSETVWFNTWLSWHAFGLKPGLRYRWREFQTQMWSPEDWARVRLPIFLYLPLRPLSWVARKIYRLISRRSVSSPILDP